MTDLEKKARIFSNTEGNQSSKLMREVEYDTGRYVGYLAGFKDCQKEYEEKLRWIPTSEQTPTATETGDWDGKRSDFVLAKTKNGSHYILRVYEGFSNGEKWVDWADKNDMIHTGIVEWRSFL